MNKKTLLITGGTGSFGNAVLNKFLKDDFFQEIRIFSRDEKKQHDMRALYGDAKIKFYIGDTRNKSSVDNAMNGVDYVFHAAALKQVPSCEFFPMEAVRTNVEGSENVLRSAGENNVKSAVLLSTDKAVYPINAMGMSKALSEKVMVAQSRTGTGNTVLSGTRYGNVMGSRGSVIPLFIDQIKQGKPLTITDPNMTRFMMTLDDAVELVWFAFNNANNGDIFVQKAPAATVKTLALALKDIYKANNPIEIIGTRHGEKRFETLVSREEMAKVQDMGRYFRIPADNRDLNYGSFFTKGEPKIAELEDYTSDNTEQLDIDALRNLLLELPDIREDLANK
ncbi:MAG: polysaccharide biosynthesis protein [Brumimicrobium sp.]|nr:polysaccharide biosynthesis protein [Brumimicrobium sp.]